MSPSRQRGRSGLVGILIFLVVIAGALVAVFSFLPAGHDTSWPLGIQENEVKTYRNIFDLTQAGVDSTLRLETVDLERVELADSTRILSVERPSPRWMVALMKTDGAIDTVRVRRLRSTDGAYLLRLPKNTSQRMDRQSVLIPATVYSMRSKYAEVMARELGLTTPEISFVRLVINGRDQGVFLREARITQQLLEKKRMSDAVLFKHAFHAYDPEHIAPEVDDSLMAPVVREKVRSLVRLADQGHFEVMRFHLDRESCLSLLLMMWCEQRLDPLLHEALFAYDRTTGKIRPLYRSERWAPGVDDPDRIAHNFLTPLLYDKELYVQFEAMRAKASGEAWRLKERFAAMDEVWLSVVASIDPQLGREHVQHIADQQKEELLDRLSNGDPRNWFTRPRLAKADVEAWGSTADSLLTYVPTADPDAELEAYAKKYAAFIMGDTLLFPRGRYIIEEDLYIPPGKTLMLRSGARLYLSPDVNILCYGPLKVRGTLLRPVFVRALDPERPWGTIAVAGDGDDLCEFKGLYMSDGSEGLVNGLLHTGMISIHNSDARFIQCSVYSAHGEDLVNVKNGKVYFQDCSFRQGHADLVDLDNATGIMRDCVLLHDTATGNGDCIDVSNTQLLLYGNTFVGSPDKGLSVGEASEVLVVHNRFEQNNTGIAIKDLSVAYVSDNMFMENRLVYHVFRKKPIFGGGRAVLYNNEYYDNGQDRVVDDLSTVVQEQQLDEGLKARFRLDDTFDRRRRKRR